MIEKTEFKGRPILILKRDEEDKYPFSFGIGKAKLIVENFDAIKEFIEENEEK